MNLTQYFEQISTQLLGPNTFYEVTAREIVEGFRTNIEFSSFKLILEKPEFGFINSNANIQTNRYCAFSIVKDYRLKDTEARKQVEQESEVLVRQVLARMWHDRTNVQALFGFDIAKVHAYYTEMPNRETAVGYRVEFQINYATPLCIKPELWKNLSN